MNKPQLFEHNGGFNDPLTHLCKQELCSEVDVLQFIRPLQVSPLLLHQSLDGLVQLPAMRPDT